MIKIEIEADGYLVNPRRPYMPRARKWREYLEDFYNYSTLSAQKQAALCADYLIGEDDFEKDLPMDRLMCSYAHESRYASVFYALMSLKLDPDSAGVLEFIEGPMPMSCFKGVRLIGSKPALNKLFKRKGLDRKIVLVSYAEGALANAVTTFVKQRLKKMILSGEDDPDRVDALLGVEAYIVAGCPDISGLLMQLQYADGLAYFPPDSNVYRRIREEVERRGVLPGEGRPQKSRM
jgi:hypothetical protein